MLSWSRITWVFHNERLRRARLYFADEGFHPSNSPRFFGNREGPHMTEHVTVVDHPLVQHKLTLMRDKARSTGNFRQLLREISQLLAYEVTRELPMTTRAIETPMEAMDAPVLDGKKLALISI